MQMKYILIIVFIFSFKFSFTQTKNNQNISLEFKTLNKLEIIKRIENASNYHFFYLKEWLDDKIYYRNTDDDIQE